jgi:hypothetical protein
LVIAALVDAPCPLLDENSHHHRRSSPATTTTTIEQSPIGRSRSREELSVRRGHRRQRQDHPLPRVTRRAGKWPALRTASVRARSCTARISSP